MSNSVFQRMSAIPALLSAILFGCAEGSPYRGPGGASEPLIMFVSARISTSEKGAQLEKVLIHFGPETAASRLRSLGSRLPRVHANDAVVGVLGGRTEFTVSDRSGRLDLRLPGAEGHSLFSSTFVAQLDWSTFLTKVWVEVETPDVEISCRDGKTRVEVRRAPETRKSTYLYIGADSVNIALPLPEKTILQLFNACEARG